MTALVITQMLEVETGDLTLFRAAVTQHAETTRHREPGCMRFDVSFSEDRPSLCLIYGIFDSIDSLDHHMQSYHHNLFNELTKMWVISRVEQVWELAASPRRVGTS